jgi:hypothetical protein
MCGPAALGFGRGANNSLPVCYEMLHRTSDLDEFSGTTLPEPLASQEGLSYTESLMAQFSSIFSCIFCFGCYELSQWSRDLLEKPTRAQPFKKFSENFATRRYFTVLQKRATSL